MAGAPADFTTYPTYLQEMHAALLTGGPVGGGVDETAYANIADLFMAATSGVGGSPYAGIQAYDPQTHLDTNQELFDTWQAALDSIDPEADIAAYVTTGTTAAGTLVNTTEIDAVAAAFEARSRGAYLREVSRAAFGVWDAGGALTTQFGMMLAAMGRDRADQLNDMSSRLDLMAERERYGSAMQLALEMNQLRMNKLQEQRIGVGGQSDLSRLAFTAYQDYLDANLRYEVSDATWDLELMNFPMQHIGALTGSVALYKQQTPGERLAASVMTAGSFGLQTGVAMKSPAAGLLAGGVSLATQLLAGIS